MTELALILDLLRQIKSPVMIAGLVVVYIPLIMAVLIIRLQNKRLAEKDELMHKNQLRVLEEVTKFTNEQTRLSTLIETLVTDSRFRVSKGREG